LSWGTEGWGLIAFGGLLALVSNVFYMWGGTKGFGLFWRRFVGAAILAGSTSFIAGQTSSWVPQYLAFYPCLILGFSLGYGGDENWKKIIRRYAYATGVLSCCLFGMWAKSFSADSIVVVVLASIIGLTSVIMGVFNPFKSARLEEFLIAQVLTLFIPFWALVK
jgi:hypothetical protein